VITVLEWCGVVVVVTLTVLVVYAVTFAMINVAKTRRRVHALRHRRAEMLRERSRR
jgi:hypothetical protein